MLIWLSPNEGAQEPSTQALEGQKPGPPRQAENVPNMKRTQHGACCSGHLLSRITQQKADHSTAQICKSQTKKTCVYASTQPYASTCGGSGGRCSPGAMYATVPVQVKQHSVSPSPASRRRFGQAQVCISNKTVAVNANPSQFYGTSRVFATHFRQKQCYGPHCHVASAR